MVHYEPHGTCAGWNCRVRCSQRVPHHEPQLGIRIRCGLTKTDALFVGFELEYRLLGIGVGRMVTGVRKSEHLSAYARLRG